MVIRYQILNRGIDKFCQFVQSSRELRIFELQLGIRHRLDASVELGNTNRSTARRAINNAPRLSTGNPEKLPTVTASEFDRHNTSRLIWSFVVKPQTLGETVLGVSLWATLFGNQKTTAHIVVVLEVAGQTAEHVTSGYTGSELRSIRGDLCRVGQVRAVPPL